MKEALEVQDSSFRRRERPLPVGEGAGRGKLVEIL